MNEEFYIECANALGTSYNCKRFPYRYRTRWNNRKAGSGRFPGFGTIRNFGDMIHVCLHFPIIHNKVYTNEEDVIIFLKQLHFLS